MGFCRDIVLGLGHIHTVAATDIPLDLGARTCQVTSGNVVKVLCTVKRLCLLQF